MIVIYAGPTISHSQIKQQLDCVCLPPVSHGDIIDLMRQSPDAIGIIDGYFEGAPSVWHKEILYAMDQGVTVYGSSSMGALRAAELCAFGMVGIGKVFEGYRDGLLEDDDEVAVLHGPEEAGFVTASVPMVNIRATLASAQQHNVIGESQTKALLAFAKRTFYKRRSWSGLLHASDELFGETSTREKLQAWLSNHKVDQKRNDALQMLKAIKEKKISDSTRPDMPFTFQWTSVWDVAVREHQQSRTLSTSLSEDDLKVLEQLQLAPELYMRYSDRALLSWMCKHRVESHVDDQMLKLALNDFRADNKLDSRSQLVDYMDKSDLTESSLIKLLTDASRVNHVRQAADNIQADIVDQLKLDGQYVSLLELAVAGENH